MVMVLRTIPETLLKTVFYGDVHSNWAYPDYMAYLDKTFDFLESHIKCVRPDILVNLGDNTDTFGMVDIRSLLWIKRRIHRLSDVMSSIHGDRYARHLIVKGNHDISDAEGEYSTTEMFGNDNTMVFIRPSVYYAPYTRTGKDVLGHPNADKIIVIPYTTDYPSVMRFLSANEVDSPDTVFICGHLDWLGVHLTPTYVSKSGMVLSDYKKLYSKPFFSGHYHNPMDMDPLFVVGSPLYKDFSDNASIQRGFLTYEPGKIDRVHNEHTYRLIQLKIEDEAGLKAIKKIPTPESTRIKITVPSALVEKAKKAAAKFLWKAVYPSDSDKQQVDHKVSVSITSKPMDVVSAAVGASDETFNRETLFKYGSEAFLL